MCTARREHWVRGAPGARRDAESYRFANEVTGQFRQSWESIASARLEPRSATLGLGASDNKARTMRLVYKGHSVRGMTTKTDSKPGVQTADVSARLPRDIVDQRIDWAALMSAAWQPGGTIRFSVYDPWTGTSPVTARIVGNEEVRVPAGAFAALHIVYRIEKKGARNRAIRDLGERKPAPFSRARGLPERRQDRARPRHAASNGSTLDTLRLRALRTARQSWTHRPDPPEANKSPGCVDCIHAQQSHS